jgi:ABC-type multidrug transport system ATPase subunit
MRQKVAIVRALLHDPAVLLLDEPTSGLDPESSRAVRRLLAERRAAGCAVLVSTHNLAEAERLADRVAVLQERLLALDTPAALRRRLATNRILVRVAGPPAGRGPRALTRTRTPTVRSLELRMPSEHAGAAGSGRRRHVVEVSLAAGAGGFYLHSCGRTGTSRRTWSAPVEELSMSRNRRRPVGDRR